MTSQADHPMRWRHPLRLRVGKSAVPRELTRPGLRLSHGPWAPVGRARLVGAQRGPGRTPGRTLDRQTPGRVTVAERLRLASRCTRTAQRTRADGGTPASFYSNEWVGQRDFLARNGPTTAYKGAGHLQPVVHRSSTGMWVAHDPRNLGRTCRCRHPRMPC